MDGEVVIMEYKFIDISEPISIPVPRNLTPEEEADIIAQYKSKRTVELLAADYLDFDKQIADGMSAEQLLKELQEDSPG